MIIYKVYYNNMTKYYFDLDNTLCKTINNDYENSIPYRDRINYCNELKNKGNHIIIWTGRGNKSKIDYTELTKKTIKRMESII